jgi:hypothetical protein
LGARVRDHTVIGRAGKNDQLAGVARWPVAAALLAVGAVYAAVSDGLTLGLRLLVPIIILLLVVALMSAHLGVLHVLARRVALVLVALVSVAVSGTPCF